MNRKIVFAKCDSSVEFWQLVSQPELIYIWLNKNAFSVNPVTSIKNQQKSV